jgi:4-hydroxybenzoate polyprenyltransferase
MRNIIKLLRPQQWYKNLLIFLPLLFASRLFELDSFLITVYGFILLCVVSSANYVFNDVLDAKNDRANKEKRFRPIAAKKITKKEGVLIGSILLTLALLLSLFNFYFFFSIFFLFAFTLLYSVVLKNEVFLDVIAIAINFVVRAVSGAFLINAIISPWLIGGVFFLSLFLSTSKRHAEVLNLGAKAKHHRKVLAHYTPILTTSLMSMSTVLLILSYSLYAFFGLYPYLFITIPIALYVILRYFQLVQQGSIIARHPELVIKDKRMVISMIVWVLMTFLIIYTKPL